MQTVVVSFFSCKYLRLTKTFFEFPQDVIGHNFHKEIARLDQGLIKLHLLLFTKLKITK